MNFNPSGGMGFVFTCGLLAPLMLLIGQGLPVDCLNMQEQIKRENNSAMKPLKLF